MHDHQLDGVAAAVVVGFQAVGDAHAPARRHALPPAEMDRIEAPAGMPELQFEVALAHDPGREHVELAIELGLGKALSN